MGCWSSMRWDGLLEEEGWGGQVSLSSSLSSLCKVKSHFKTPVTEKFCPCFLVNQTAAYFVLGRFVRLLLQLLIIVLLVLLYCNQEEALGEVKSFHARLFPPSLPPAPTWKATKAALGSLPPLPTITATTTASAPVCHLPVLDPWHPAILPYVSDNPTLVRTKLCFHQTKSK